MKEITLDAATLVGFVMLTVMLFWIAIVLQSIFLLPTVYTNWATRECVAIVNAAPEHSCRNLPVRYRHKWIE